MQSLTTENTEEDALTKCTQATFAFPSCKSRKVTADFAGGNVPALEGDPQELYDEGCCARGNMENRIKEQQLDLYADRTSCHKWWGNPFRLLLSSPAYILFDHIRRAALQNTRLANATSATIRNKLIRIGAVVLRNTRRIRLHLSSACPHQDIFAVAAARLE